MPPTSSVRRHRADVLIGLGLFLVGTVVVFFNSGALDPRLLDWATIDVWFEADVPRVYDNLINRWSNYYRAKVHPLFAFILFPPVFVLDRVVGLESFTAVRVVLGLLAGLWMAAFYALLRLIGNRRIEAVIFALVAATSAAAVFWFAVPETHTLGSFTIILAMLLVAVAAHRRVPHWLDAAVSALTLGVTVTNWMAGVMSTAVRRSVLRTAVVTASAFALVLALWVVRKQVMPSTAFFLGNPPETEHILSPESRGPTSVSASFFLHTVVMPAIEVVDRPGAGQWPIMLTQPASPGSAGGWGTVSLALWVGLLAMGLIALLTLKTHGRLRFFLAAVITGQLLLHVAFGNETFLYAPNFLPLLVVLPALAALTPMRPMVLVAAAALIVTNGINNTALRARADTFLGDYESLRHDVRQARRFRPTAPWPDTTASIVKVGTPGARQFDEGSYGPAGSFSPGLDLFGVSFWVTGPDGSFSEGQDIDGPVTEKPLVESGVVAGMHVVTGAYEVRWRAIRPRQWRLMVIVPDGPDRVAIAIRGVGPEIGPVRSLQWDGRSLAVNDRWTLTPDRPLDRVYLVEEGTPGWMSARPARTRIEVENGWAAARIELPGAGRYNFTVRDELPHAPIDRALGRITADASSRRVSAGAPAPLAVPRPVSAEPAAERPRTSTPSGG